MSFVCYLHRRADTGEVFYVGIGKPGRPTRTRGRSRYWKNVVARAGVDVEVVAEDVSWEQACKWERAAIALLGRRDLGTGPLVNMTDGGDGVPGRVVGDAERAAVGARARAYFADPAARAAQAERARAQFANPAFRVAHAERWQAQLADPSFRAALAKRRADPVVRAAQAERGRVYFADPAARAAQAERGRAYFADPVVRATQADRNRRLAQNPEWRAKIAEAARRRSQDPEWLARAAERNRRLAQSPEWRAKTAEGVRRRSQDPEWRATNAAASRAVNSRPVLNLDMGEVFPSSRAAIAALAARGIRVTSTGLSAACRGERKTHAGYRWQFVNDNKTEVRS